MKYFVVFIIFTFLVFLLYIRKEDITYKHWQVKFTKKVNQNLGILLILLILIIGTVARSYLFGKIPNGINVDEAASGYDAYALLNFGIDMNGYRNPLVLIGFGSGHQSLYTYFSMPFIAIFGLNQISIKMVNLVFGILSLIIFYLIVRRTDSNKVAMIALFLLATNPWHIMISRWGLDCNLFPAIFLIATYLLTFYEEKPAFFILSMAIYGLALYSYETSYFFLPIFIFILTIYLVMQKKIGIKTLLTGLLVFCLIGLPILIYLIINTFNLDPVITNWFSIPKTLGPTRYSSVSTIFLNNNFFRNSLENVISLFRFIFFQEDNYLMIQNFVPGYGTTYLFSFPFQLIGLWVLVQENMNKKTKNKNVIYLIWLAASILLGVAMKININRINIIFIPLIYLIAKSIVYISERLKTVSILIMVVFLTGFIFFTDTYFHTWPKQVSPAYNESLDKAINYAADHANGTIYVSKTIHKSYIYVLFNRRINPLEFLDSVVYENPTMSSRDVISFGQYQFLDITAMPRDGGAYIIDDREKEYFNLDSYRLNQFNNFAVLTPIN